MARKEQLPFSVAYGVGLVLASAQKIINPVLLQYFLKIKALTSQQKLLVNQKIVGKPAQIAV